MAILRTEAVVLRSLAYGETSKIITVLSRDYGKLNMLARGARDFKSKFGGSLELLNQVQIVYYEKENRDLQYLTEAVTLNPFLGLRNEPQRLYAGLAILEFCSKAVHGNEEVMKIYSLVVDTFNRLNQCGKTVTNGLIHFLIEFSTHLGFRLDFKNCLQGKDLLEHDEIYFDISQGRFLCRSCPAKPVIDTSTPLSREALSIARYLMKSNGHGVDNVVISDKVKKELFQLLIRHLQYHVEELNTLNVLKFYEL
jgi:DNA repair protein RecO (recombination protein O)